MKSYLIKLFMALILLFIGNNVKLISSDIVPRYDIIEPYSGQEYFANTNLEIKWECADSDSLYFYNQDTTFLIRVDIYLWDVDNQTWGLIGSNISGLQESYVWNIPINKIGEYYRIKIVDKHCTGDLFSISEEFFHIKLNPQPILNVENPLERYILLYPNPAKDYIQIELPEKCNNSRINIYNNIGECVYSQFINTNLNRIKISLVDLPKGLYFCILIDEKNSYLNKFLIIK